MLHDWSLAANSGYYVIRNGSSLVAFRTGTGDPAAQGVRMVGAHTDSPCLKVKPNPVLRRKGYFQLGVEVYGGALLNPWFDRELSLAGRVTLQEASGQVRDVLVNFRQPPAVENEPTQKLRRDCAESILFYQHCIEIESILNLRSQCHEDPHS